MAYADFYQAVQSDSFTQRLAVACVRAAIDVLNDSASAETKQTWALRVMASISAPMAMAQKIIWYILALDTTVRSNLKSASDAQLYNAVVAVILDNEAVLARVSE
ncbi:hypothetical protein [Desulfonema ishimotonii]|uniref:hypothetical protein n=1 Tax=Desulfonema ishimotonii TaxID=45657 RepID=UPI000F56A02A|nr:hypothetical protein [Desulfonema ishimotonii]